MNDDFQSSTDRWTPSSGFFPIAIEMSDHRSFCGLTGQTGMHVNHFTTKKIIQGLVLLCGLLSALGTGVFVWVDHAPQSYGGAALHAIDDGCLFLVQDPRPGKPVWKMVREGRFHSESSVLLVTGRYGVQPEPCCLQSAKKPLPDRKADQYYRTGHWARPPPSV